MDKKEFIVIIGLLAAVMATEKSQVIQTNVNLSNNEGDSSAEKYTSVDSTPIQVLGYNQGIQDSRNTRYTPIDSTRVQVLGYDSNDFRQGVTPLVKEANSQYQYQLNSKYEENTRPRYPTENANFGNYKRANPLYQYKDNSQIQVQANSQRKSESNLPNDIRFNNQVYSGQAVRAYSEYGNGEITPEHNTYMYRQIHY